MRRPRLVGSAADLAACLGRRLGYVRFCHLDRVVAVTNQEGGADPDDSGDDNSDPAAPPVELQTSTGNYCGSWVSFAWMGFPDHGAVNLYENGVSVTQYQGSREWATARCAAVLARLGQ